MHSKLKVELIVGIIICLLNCHFPLIYYCSFFSINIFSVILLQLDSETYATMQWKKLMLRHWNFNRLWEIINQVQTFKLQVSTYLLWVCWMIKVSFNEICSLIRIRHFSQTSKLNPFVLPCQSDLFWRILKVCLYTTLEVIMLVHNCIVVQYCLSLPCQTFLPKLVL
jgi:hypothetical protein